MIRPVIYDHEPICLLSNDSSACHKKRALKFKINKLFSRAQDVCKEVEHDEIQPKKMRRMEVQHWLTAVDRIRDEVQNIATDDQSIENFTSQVDELLQQGNFPHGYVLPDDSPIEFPLLSKNPAGKMFAKNTAIILEWLKNNERCIIGVYGMGGVGKTTMLKWLHNEVRKNECNFGRPYWVTVSQNCDEHKLQNEIAKELGVDLSGENDDRKRAAILHKRLSMMGPTVLFLDDVWKWNPFLGKDIEFPLKGSCCKIILSSRSSKVCQEMGCKDFTIKAEVLPKGEAWNLFVDKLGYYDKLTEEAKGIARLIAEKCGGLPLAIATMARSMTEVVDVREWKDALNELRQRSWEQQSDMEEYVLLVLKYSYNRLNDQRLQNCFLSCILYPEDYKIKRKDLIDEWIMEGLLDDVGNRSKQLNKGHAILNKLINSCLLEACTRYDGYGGRHECVTMHDLMRDLAIMITKEYPCFMVKPRQHLDGLPEEQLWCKELVKVSLTWNDIAVIPNGMAPPTPELTLLKLNNNPLKSIPESFFMHMQALTVLDLSDTDIVRLPESVSDLANLRALLLASCFKLTYVPSLAKLSNLRALLLASCSELTYVPSLAKLSNLRVLDLNRAEMLEKAPDGIEKLKCLEKLYIGSCKGLKYILSSSSSSSGPQEGSFIEVMHLNHLPDLRGLIEFEGCTFTHLCDLKIEHCPKIKLIFPLSEKRLSLPNLKYLRVLNCDELEEIFNHHNSGLPNLVSVYLKSLPKLQRLYMNPHLCDSLEELSVWNCEELEEIFESGSSSTSSSTSQGGTETLVIDPMSACIPQPNPVSALPRLREISLGNLPKLGSIYKNLHLCTSLEELRVWKCKELEEIFESGGSYSPSSSSQGEAETLVFDPMNACNSPANPISALSKLRIISLGFLPKLKKIYKDLHLCSSLEVLEVVYFPKIEQIFEAPEPILALPNLRELKLHMLTNLSSIHRGLLLCTSLKKMYVEDCFKVKNVPLSDHLICDDSPSSLLSLPSKSDNPEFWELLQSDYSEDARLLSDLIQYHNQKQLKLKRKRSDLEGSTTSLCYS